MAFCTLSHRGPYSCDSDRRSDMLRHRYYYGFSGEAIHTEYQDTHTNAAIPPAHSACQRRPWFRNATRPASQINHSNYRSAVMALVLVHGDMWRASRSGL